MPSGAVLHSAMFSVAAVIIIFLSTVECEQSLTRLYRFLLGEYEKNVRPSTSHSLPVNVAFSFSLTQIIDVDERNQIITINAWVRQSWTDIRLIWEPLNYDNISSIHIPYQNVWRPDVILYNNADSHYKESVMSTDVLVDFRGNVSWTLAAIFKSSCPLDVRFYPFDYQNCTLKFASWAYDITKIDVFLTSDQGGETYFIPSSEWHLNGIRAKKDYDVFSCCPEKTPYIAVYISIQRRPMFYVFNLILPCILISMISLLGFYMPSDSGEKVTLGITSLLSTTVFLMLVAEGMPPTAEALPLIAIYYGVTIFLVSLATSMTVFTLNIHHQGFHGDPVPPALKKLAFNILAPILCFRVAKYHSITGHVNYFYQKGVEKENRSKEKESSEYAEAKEGSNSQTFSNDGVVVKSDDKASFVRNMATIMNHNTQSENNSDKFENEFLNVLHSVHATIARNEMRLAEKDRRHAANLEWQQVALVLDRFLLAVFVLGTATVSFCILYQKQLIVG
ncbi:hypothetical protein AB6A40_000204 [Gnathostoma spinigerum]|uniref:Uncharacterized protein n=1 Tax=Gnathostoma spinigerum TaxID=75299 RepID=A0ABD6E2J4_9BILA